MKGIDISNYQTVADYSAVASSGVQAAYLKASEGRTYRDKLVDIHYHGLKPQGVKIGFYHFFRASVNATQQADFFVSIIKGFKYDLIPVCDVETTEGLGRDAISSAVKTFIDRVRELTGIECMIYTGSSFSKTYLNSSLQGTKLWLAHYTSGTPSWNTSVWGTWAGWQYSSSGTVRGISGNVDVNQFTEEILIPREEKDMKKVVLYLGDADIFYGALALSQHLGCPLMRKSDFEAGGYTADEIHQVGGKAPNRDGTFKDTATKL